MDTPSSVSDSLPETIASFISQKLSRVKAKFREEFDDLRRAADVEKKKVQTLEREVRLLRELPLTTDGQRLREQNEDHPTSVSEVNVKIDRFSADVDFIRATLADLVAEMTTKASLIDFHRIESHLPSLCPIEKLEALTRVVDTKAPLSALDPLQGSIRQLGEELRGRYAERQSVKLEFQRVEEKLDSNVKLLVTSQYFQRVNMELQKTIDMLRLRSDESYSELRRKTNSTKEELDKLKATVDLKASQAQVSDIKKILSICASVSQVDAVASALMSFRSLFNTYKEETAALLEAQEKVLQRFDEVFLEKANKIDFMEIEKKLDAVSKHIDFERRVDTIESQVNAAAACFQKHEEDMADMRRQVEASTQFFKNIKSEKRDIAILKSTLQDVFDSLASKAEKSQLAELQDAKASCGSIDSLTKAIETMHRLDTITLVLLQHTIKYLNGSVDVKSIEWLVKHADLATAWVSLYEPITNEIQAPKECEALTHSSLNSRTPTTPNMRPTTAGLSLLTPTRKSRPITPTSACSSRLVSSAVPSRRTTKHSFLQPPSLDATLFPS